jgi:hypothetical protein
MDFSQMIDKAISFASGNPIIAVAVALLLIFLVYRDPKFFLKLLLIVIILAGIFYLIMNLASTGTSQKGKMLDKGIHPGMDQYTDPTSR